jgi:hypothetical protein
MCVCVPELSLTASLHGFTRNCAGMNIQMCAVPAPVVKMICYRTYFLHTPIHIYIYIYIDRYRYLHICASARAQTRTPAH